LNGRRRLTPAFKSISLIVRFLLLLIITLFIKGCSHGQDLKDDCLVPYLPGEYDADCGSMLVPESRNNETTRLLRLSYVVLKATRQSKNDPILFLQGGPGASATSMIKYFQESPLREKHDLILFDQRGTGYSEAVCTDASEKFIQILAEDISDENEELERLVTLTSDCKESLIRNGYDFSSYNSLQSAKDIEALRQHLGYDRMILFGGSYGTRLALTYAREYPNRIYAMVLMGLFPPEANLYSGLLSNLHRSLNLFLDECTSTPRCNSKYPGLKNRFYRTIEELRTNPYRFNYNGESIVINAQDYLLLLHQTLYSRQLYGIIPRLILSIENKDNDSLIDGLTSFVYMFRLINGPMYWSVNAYEELPFNGIKDLKSDLQKNPSLNPGPAFFMSDPAMLERWHSFRAKGIENMPVETSIPTLLVNGEYDPITPPENATSTMKYLRVSFYKEFKGEGHSILNSCFTDVMLEFIAEPHKAPKNPCNNYRVPVDW